MYGHLIALHKQTGVHLVGVGETWRRLFVKVLVRVTGPEAASACKDEQMCAYSKRELTAHSTGLKLFVTLS